MSFATMRRLLRNISAFFLFVLFIGFWSSTHLFYHTHIVDGQIIVHSHPFGNSSSGHTSQELKLISILSVFLTTSPDCDGLLPGHFSLLVAQLHFPCPAGHIKDFPVHYNGLRAPPAQVIELCWRGILPA